MFAVGGGERSVLECLPTTLQVLFGLILDDEQTGNNRERLIGRESRMAGLKATDAQGPSECGRELCRTEFVHDSKVGLSLNIPLQIVCEYSGHRW
jgi:hypothetical protein